MSDSLISIVYQSQVETLFTEEQRAAIRELAVIEVNQILHRMFESPYPEAKNEVQVEALKMVKDTLALGHFVTTPTMKYEIPT